MMTSSSARNTILSLYLTLMIAAITCVILPLIGAKGYFTDFKTPYVTSAHFPILNQFPGPVFTLLFSSLLRIPFIQRKRIGWWLWLIALIGPLYTARAARDLAHDFSHVVFEECGAVYGRWINGLCGCQGLALLAIAFLLRSKSRRSDDIAD